MTPEQANQILNSWEKKLAGRSPTPGEEAIIWRYRQIAAGVNIAIYDKLASDNGDRPEDL